METNDLAKVYASKAKAVQATLMRNVYTWMTLALVITGLVSLYVAKSYTLLSMIIENRMLFWGLLIAEIGLVIYLSRTHPPDCFQHRYPAFYRLLHSERSHTRLYLYDIHHEFHCHHILCYGRYLWRNGTLWLCNQERLEPYRKYLHHGTDRTYHCFTGQPVPA